MENSPILQFQQFEVKEVRDVKTMLKKGAFLK